MVDPKKPSEDDPQQPEDYEGWREPPEEEGSSRPVVVDAWYAPGNTVPEEADQSPAAPESDVLPGVTPEQTGAWHTPIDAQLDALFSGAASTIADEIHEPEPPKPQPQPSVRADTQPLASTQPQPPVSQTQPSAAQPTQPQAAQPPVPAAETPAAPIQLLPAQPQQRVEDEQVETRILAASQLSGQPPASPIPEPAVSADSTPIPETTPPQPVSPGLSPAEAAMLAERRAIEQAAGTAAPMPAAPAAQPVIPQRPGTVSAPTPAAQPTPAAPLQPSPYEEVERKVQGLRGQYNAGRLTKEQLQTELRRLMILGEDGRWWMLGLEFNRWYGYDGRDWKEGIPPGYQQPVRGSAVRTETGMQEVVSPNLDLGEAEGTLTQIEIDEDGMPLPRRVPQDDPGATLVSPSTPFMEPMRPSDAQTLSRSRQVEPDSAAYAGYDAAPLDDMGQPVRPAAEPAYGEPTIRSAAAGAAAVAGSSDVTAPRGIPVPPRAGEPPAVQQPQQPAKPKYRLGEYPQPDYRVALGRDRRAWTRRLAYFIVIGVIATMAITLLVLLAMIGYYLYEVDRYSEAVDSLRERSSNFETTVIMDANGTKLAEFSDPNTGPRQEVPLYEISPWLIHATVSTENETFYTDPGFSILAIARAAYQNVQEGDTVSGASTITQQLARALILETEFASQRTTERKLVEIVVASEIKRKYNKNDILEIYLNEIFYGNRAYGIEAAAQTYFSKSAKDLNPAEAAFLAGLPQSPATYDPVVNREAAIQRMHTVLRLMAEANGTGCITSSTTTRPSGPCRMAARCVSTAQPQADGSTVYYYQTPNMEAPQELTLEIALVEIAPFRAPADRVRSPAFCELRVAAVGRDIWPAAYLQRRVPRHHHAGRDHPESRRRLGHGESG